MTVSVNSNISLILGSYCAKEIGQNGLNCRMVKHTKEIGISQTPTTEPSKKKKMRRSSIHYICKKRKLVRTQKTVSKKAPIVGRRMPKDLSKSMKYM